MCVIDVFSNYAWVVPLKDKKGITITNGFQKILEEFNRKPTKIWADKGSEFYNISFKKWLKDNDIEMYSIHNKGKSVVAERFIRTLKNKIFKHMTAISKNVYFDVLDDIVNKYNNTVHRTIKMKPIDVKDNTYVDSKKEVNDKDPNLKLEIMSEFLSTKIFLQKNTHQTGLKKFLVKLKMQFHRQMLLRILMMKKLQEHFMKKNCKRLIKKNYEKVINYMSNGKAIINHLIAG